MARLTPKERKKREIGMIPDKMCELDIQIALEGEGLTREDVNDILIGFDKYRTTTFAIDDRGKPTEKIVYWDQYHEPPTKHQLKTVGQTLTDSRIPFEDIGLWEHKVIDNQKCLVFTCPPSMGRKSGRWV